MSAPFHEIEGVGPHDASGGDPQPPYGADVRAKGWRFELDHERILQSDTWALAAEALRPWLLMLWLTAWRQTPCGSLPTNDELIAKRIGMPLQDFAANRGLLMRGWRRHADGRLYHDTIVEIAQAMLEARGQNTNRQAAYRARKAKEAEQQSRVTNAAVPTDFVASHDTGTSTGTGTGDTSLRSVGAPTSGSGSSRRLVSAPSTRGTRLRPEWDLPKTWGDWAIQKYPHWTPEKVRDEATQFRNHWTSKTGKDATKHDWYATWQNWCMSPMAHRAGPGGKPVNRQEAIEAENRRVGEEWLRQRETGIATQ